MKNLVLIAFLVVSGSITAQGIEYIYDDAGNRKQRKEFVLGGGGSSSRLANPKEELKSKVTQDFELSVYPNPVKEYINLSVSGTFQPYEMAITDLTGKQIMNASINEATKQFNLSELPKGIYIIRTTIKNEFSEWKMVKQ